MPDSYLFGLLGHPLSNSLSPILHRAALQFAGLKGDYHLIDIAPESFNANSAKELIASLPKEFNGFNITIPYKEDIF